MLQLVFAILDLDKARMAAGVCVIFHGHWPISAYRFYCMVAALVEGNGNFVTRMKFFISLTVVVHS